MAETTTATWCPASTSFFTRCATWRMRSMPAIEVPPNFITMRGMTAALFVSRRSVQGDCGKGLDRGMAETNTIDPKEAAHFGAMAADWWDPKGSSAMLHQLNPVRLAYIRDRIDQHWGLDECSLRPLDGRAAA